MVQRAVRRGKGQHRCRAGTNRALSAIWTVLLARKPRWRLTRRSIPPAFHRLPSKRRKLVSEAATAAREISNENYGQMAEDAETAYASMTLDAENAWDRMEKAASEGAENIIGSFQKILSAADAVSGININLSSSANIPHNADGTDDFEGGWTHINERGGEMHICRPAPQLSRPTRQMKLSTTLPAVPA